MELAVLLAAGLRDWVDFGVIVRLLSGAPFFFTQQGDLDWDSYAQCFRRLVPRETSGRHRRTTQSWYRHEGHCALSSSWSHVFLD